jgi:hypothetical protein
MQSGRQESKGKCGRHMPREEGALNTHIDPREREIREGNTPVLFALVCMRLGNQT